MSRARFEPIMRYVYVLDLPAFEPDGCNSVWVYRQANTQAYTWGVSKKGKQTLARFCVFNSERTVVFS